MPTSCQLTCTRMTLADAYARSVLACPVHGAGCAALLLLWADTAALRTAGSVARQGRERECRR